jgi:hypothetical protein
MQANTAEKHPTAHETGDTVHADFMDAATRNCPHHFQALLLMKLGVWWS